MDLFGSRFGTNRRAFSLSIHIPMDRTMTSILPGMAAGCAWKHPRAWILTGEARIIFRPELSQACLAGLTRLPRGTEAVPTLAIAPRCGILLCSPGRRSRAGFSARTTGHRLLPNASRCCRGRSRRCGKSLSRTPLHDLTPDRIDELIAETLAVIDDPYCADLFGELSAPKCRSPA